MSASNIYLRLITATGPVIGEGLLEGWETSIELKSFNWGMVVRKEKEKNSLSLSSLANLVGLGAGISVQMQPLSFTKRFDVASSHIHFCLDHKIKVLSATITVLHIKPSVIPPHAPGFVLNAVDGYFEAADLEVSPDGNMAELSEVVTMNFKSIQMSYMKPVNGQPLPTAPFFYPNPI
jgi:hypothetical protein